MASRKVDEGIVDTFLTVVRATHFAAVMSLAGDFAFLVLVFRPAFRGVGADSPLDADDYQRRLTQWAWISLGIGLISGMFWLVLVGVSMSDRPLAEVWSQGILATVLTHTQFGRDCELRLGCGILLALCLLGTETWWHSQVTATVNSILLFLSAVVLVALAWAGHAGIMGGWLGHVHLTADSVHLLAAGTWLGGLMPLALLYHKARHTGSSGWVVAAQIATRRFSLVGVICVGALIVTGMTNAWFMVGSMAMLTESNYGRLLMIKLGLFAVLISIAATNRLRLMPRLCSLSPLDALISAKSAVWRLQRNTLIEVGLGVLILIIIGVLGITPPALHVHAG